MLFGPRNAQPRASREWLRGDCRMSRMEYVGIPAVEESPLRRVRDSLGICPETCPSAAIKTAAIKTAAIKTAAIKTAAIKIRSPWVAATEPIWTLWEFPEAAAIAERLGCIRGSSERWS